MSKNTDYVDLHRKQQNYKEAALRHIDTEGECIGDDCVRCANLDEVEKEILIASPGWLIWITAFFELFHHPIIMIKYEIPRVIRIRKEARNNSN